MDFYSLPDLAELLGVPFTRIRQYRKERRFGVLLRDGKAVVPAVFFDESVRPAQMYDYVAGTITLLMDGGMNEHEACEWMIVEHPSLGDSPISVIRAGGHHRVNRVAVVEAF